MAGEKLLSLFRDKMNKSKSSNVKEATFDVMYPTGFITLDYLNGTMIHVKSDTIDDTYSSVGILDGSSNTFIGRSGSGKSTFMKMLTERIRLEKSTEIPSTSRFLFFDEKLKSGSLSIYEELFCCSENPDLEKMQKILSEKLGINLTSENTKYFNKFE